MTTGITDGVLAIICVAMMFVLLRTRTSHPWKQRLWSSLLGLAGFASLLGFTVHGFDWGSTVSAVLWHPLYASLGLVVALFVVGGLYDLKGHSLARRFLPCAVGAGLLFYAWVQTMDGNFLLFVVYEAVAMLTALLIYLYLAATKTLSGAAVVAAAIVLNLAAAGVQASDIEIHVVWPFDHNGLFHLVQMVAIVVLTSGLSSGLRDNAS